MLANGDQIVLAPSITVRYVEEAHRCPRPPTRPPAARLTRKRLSAPAPAPQPVRRLAGFAALGFCRSAQDPSRRPVNLGDFIAGLPADIAASADRSAQAPIDLCR